MKDAEKEIFIASVKELESDYHLKSELADRKALLIYHAQKENWDKVAQLAEELSILREERLLRMC